MKYNININQKAVIDLNLHLDVVDMAIFDFIKDFSNSKGCLKVFIEGKQYFWISHSKIISDLPIIRITSRQGIIKRINKLIDSELIERIEVDLQKSYYCFGKNYDGVIFVADVQQPFTPPVNQSLREPDNERLHNNSITNNNTNDNKTVLFSDSIYNDYHNLKTTLAKDDNFVKKYAYTNLKHYIEDCLLWSDAKNQKRTNKGWLATLRNFMKRDLEDGKLVKIETPKRNGEQGHINY